MPNGLSQFAKKRSFQEVGGASSASKLPKIQFASKSTITASRGISFKTPQEAIQSLSREDVDFSKIPLPVEKELENIEYILKEKLEEIGAKVSEQVGDVKQDTPISPNNTIEKDGVRIYFSEKYRVGYVHFDSVIVKNIISMMSATYRKSCCSEEQADFSDTTGKTQRIHKDNPLYELYSNFLALIKRNTVAMFNRDPVEESKISYVTHRREKENITAKGIIHLDPSDNGGVFIVKIDSVDYPLEIYDPHILHSKQYNILKYARRIKTRSIVENNSANIRDNFKPLLTLAPYGKHGVLCAFMHPDVVHGVGMNKEDNSDGQEYRTSFFAQY